ncbi:MAG: outer membrane beta-barrel protein [Hyphomonadaceae bacterium]|nr:outer membrane beta-barrel protein [Hyphomonadaceae bacterium]
MYKTLAAALALGGIAHAQPAAEPPLTPTPAPADAPPGGGAVVFEPGFFAQYAPQTALDMVRRVPGFTVDEGAERRGFSGAAGNVLIDGARPSAKSQGLEAILNRIPAAQVVRLELIRAASTGEASGQSVLVNVVRSAAARGGSGTWAGELERSVSNRVTARGEASYTNRLGAAEYTVGADRYLEERPLRGFRFLRDAGDGLTGSRSDFTPRTYREAGANAQLSTPLWGGTLNLNVSGGRWNFATDLESTGFSPSEAITDSFRLSIDEREREREIGGDFERKLGPWTLKAIGLDTRVWYANDEQTLSRDAAFNPVGLVAQRTRYDSVETIGRLTASLTINPAHRVEFGGEAALNTLDANLNLTEDGVPIVLPAANVTVEEERQEGFVTWTWKPGARWTVESGATVETSTIAQTGDTSASRTLTYWKPSMQVSRQVGARDQVRAKIFRDVSQLDFGDFVSSATLADNVVAAGNPDLRPQATWRLEGVIDKRFGEKGAVALTVGREWIEDATDLIPILDPASGRLFDAPGNIGEGDVWNARLKGTLPLERVLAGAQLEFNLFWADAEVTDPTTRATRQISGDTNTAVELAFRQDLTARKVAWGANFYKESELRFFRVAERETYEEGPFLLAFVETTRIPGVKVRLYGDNLLDSEFRRERRFFNPDRRGAFASEEERERQFGRFVGIEVSGNF